MRTSAGLPHEWTLAAEELVVMQRAVGGRPQHVAVGVRPRREGGQEVAEAGGARSCGGRPTCDDARVVPQSDRRRLPTSLTTISFPMGLLAISSVLINVNNELNSRSQQTARGISYKPNSLATLSQEQDEACIHEMHWIRRDLHAAFSGSAFPGFPNTATR